MNRNNAVRKAAAPQLVEPPEPRAIRRELKHLEEAIAPPGHFATTRRLKEIERRQQRAEEMLSAIFLALEEIRGAVGATGEEPGGVSFRLPPSRPATPPVTLSWWRRAWYAFISPYKLRRPGADRW